MEKTFESSLDELEKIVGQLEDGDMPLEKSLKLFEDGVKLSLRMPRTADRSRAADRNTAKGR